MEDNCQSMPSHISHSALLQSMLLLASMVRCALHRRAPQQNACHVCAHNMRP